MGLLPESEIFVMKLLRIKRSVSDYIGKAFLECENLVVNRISQCGMTFFIHMFTVGNTWRSEISSIQENADGAIGRSIKIRIGAQLMVRDSVAPPRSGK